MASWDDLLTWVRVRYEIMAQTADTLRFLLPTGGDRTQLVFVRHVGFVEGQDWIQIQSPIGRLDDIDARHLLQLAEDIVVGGAAAVGGLAVYRHSAALEDMSYAEFDEPFRLVTAAADDLEHKLTGTDRF